MTVSAGSRRRQLRQVVNVHTNDPQNSIIQLTVTAQVLVDLEVVPTNLLRFDQDHTGRASVAIKNYGDTPVQLKDVQVSTEYVNVSVSSMEVAPQGETSITGELLPDAPSGVLSGWITIRTDHKTLPLIQIRIWGNLP
ncbi:DUF1573 domain-containing protein [candidate division KSB3 bacterium]|uniref:DUF1573 domain-containing protein n=1 Tax=candidate division KSB3 bacterium TaxID=2044937 RepID=A0A9D5JV82_9BACT|nr:DUF1573 domain-containing protein [candidate division KSB3 bacterium]MBD3324879.1 DUF1573 domain-containing protein [candidate division KSB3 bacterium]